MIFFLLTFINTLYLKTTNKLGVMRTNVLSLRPLFITCNNVMKNERLVFLIKRLLRMV